MKRNYFRREEIQKYSLDWGATEFVLLGIHFSVDLDKIPDLNYDIQIPKITALIQQWERRALTPIGRVTVLKSLNIVPKINHLIISLTNPRYIYRYLFLF